MTTPLIKQPGESLLYSLPVSLPTGTAITTVESVTVTTRGLVTEVTALTTISPTFSGANVQFRAAGGTDGENYLITVVCQIDNGETVEAEGELWVLDLAWTVPGDPGGSYLTPQDYIARFGIDELVQLTDGTGTGRVDKAALYAALADATAQVEAYLGKRYLLPLSPVPALIPPIVADIARYTLHGTGVPDAVSARFKDAERMLDRLSKGTMVLASGTPLSATPAAPTYSSPTKVFSDDSLEGY